MHPLYVGNKRYIARGEIENGRQIKNGTANMIKINRHAKLFYYFFSNGLVSAWWRIDVARGGHQREWAMIKTAPPEAMFVINSVSSLFLFANHRCGWFKPNWYVFDLVPCDVARNATRATHIRDKTSNEHSSAIKNFNTILDKPLNTTLKANFFWFWL